jgi:hypothetical protein
VIRDLDASVLDRELEEENKLGTSEPPRVRCPLCGWSPRKDDKWGCTCGNKWNTFDTLQVGTKIHALCVTEYLQAPDANRCWKIICGVHDCGPGLHTSCGMLRFPLSR